MTAAAGLVYRVDTDATGRPAGSAVPPGSGVVGRLHPVRRITNFPVPEPCQHILENQRHCWHDTVAQPTTESNCQRPRTNLAEDAALTAGLIIECALDLSGRLFLPKLTRQSIDARHLSAQPGRDCARPSQETIRWFWPSP